MKKRITVLIMMCTLIFGSVSAYAGTMSSNIHADHGDATASLTTKFRNRLFGSDTATASTSFVTNNGNYRVAVRLECWNSNSMMDYVYRNDANSCTVTHTHDDVSNFRSRHSIDNSNNTVEYEVKTYYINEF